MGPISQTLLLVEDNPGDARLVREMLRQSGSQTMSLRHVGSLAEAEAALAEESVDVVLLDLGLPDAEGLEAVRRIRLAAPHTPLVVLTRMDDEELAYHALEEGAQDYLIKGEIETSALLRALHYAIDRSAMEAALSAEHSQLEATNKVLDRRNEDLEAFTYSVSHDLKEPLRAIEGFSQYLVGHYSDKIDDRGQDLLNRISRASIRTKQLIDDLLALSRAGRETDAEHESTNTGQVVDEVIESLGLLSHGSAVEIKIGVLPALAADRTRVDQIFRNLITNGLKYNRDVRPSIEIGVLQRTGATVTFYIKDNGIGIDPQYHDKIFELFQRLHTRDEFEGNGAGLTIVRRAVEALAGKVWLESSEGVGTTFFVSLPAADKIASTAEETIAV